LLLLQDRLRLRIPFHSQAYHRFLQGGKLYGAIRQIILAKGTCGAKLMYRKRKTYVQSSHVLFSREPFGEFMCQTTYSWVDETLEDAGPL